MRILPSLVMMWRQDWPHERVRRVLVVQTANAPVFNKIFCGVRRRFQTAAIELAIHPEMEKALPADHGCTLLHIDRKNKLQFVRKLKSRRYDTVVVGFCGERGFWKLKILPFLLGAQQVLVYNENAGAFAFNRYHLGAMRRHLKWRMMQALFPETGMSESLPLLLAEEAVRRVLAGPAFLWVFWRAARWERKRRRVCRRQPASAREEPG